MLEPRFETLFADLERILTDYRSLRRQLPEPGSERQVLRHLQRRVQGLEAENILLRQRQELVCQRLGELLGQIEVWEDSEDGELRG